MRYLFNNNYVVSVRYDVFNMLQQNIHLLEKSLFMVYFIV